MAHDEALTTNTLLGTVYRVCQALMGEPTRWKLDDQEGIVLLWWDRLGRRVSVCYNLEGHATAVIWIIDGIRERDTTMAGWLTDNRFLEVRKWLEGGPYPQWSVS